MDKNKMKWIRQISLLAGIVAVVVFFAIMPLLVRQPTQVNNANIRILSGNAEYTQLQTELIGGGPLLEEPAVAVTVPAGIRLSSWLTYDGVTVTEGMPIATVDRVSVMAAITEAQKTLDQLTRQIKNAGSTGNREAVTAPAGGVVKILHAKEGDSATAVMLEHGALAVLSLDNLLAVKIFTDSDLPAGTPVTVTFKDGSTVPGRVVKNLNSYMTVTIEDRGYNLDEEVSVTTQYDVYLSSGKLYIYSPWNITANTGTVETIRVRIGDRLSAGQALMTLGDVGYSAQFRQLVDQRQQLEEQMAELVRMYQEETILAPCAGIITVTEEAGSDKIAQITPQEKMTLQIAVDELDIQALQLGMTAQVKINSMGGEAMEATITAMDNLGTSHGGSSKYTVELTMERAERMLAGMKATATLVLSVEEKALTVPADALVEQGNETVVYTGYDQKSGKLKKPVTVTVGNADGERVQILEGLTEGQTYYYAYYDAPNFS